MSLSTARLNTIEQLARRIHELAYAIGRPVQLMEVCGTHSHAIGRYGLRQLLPETVRLVSGPGCPVCVTTGGQIATAVALAGGDVTLATFGDMVRVPGPTGSLADARARGADIRVIYSPMQAVEIAAREQEREVVLLAVGFETTAPGVAAAILEAASLGLSNFSVLSFHKLIPPALEHLVSDPAVQIDGFLCPGHVSVIIGVQAYRSLARNHGVPCVVAGFEPDDILRGVAMLMAQIADGRAEAENAYPRAVTERGNERARALIAQAFEPERVAWRGLGTIPASGLKIAARFADYDALTRYRLTVAEFPDPPGCRCGDVLRGVIRPQACPLFATACTPLNPVGPCMVSSEGSCAAAYKYERAAAVR